MVIGVGVGDDEASLATVFESGTVRRLVVVGCEWANGELGIRVRLRAEVRD